MNSKLKTQLLGISIASSVALLLALVPVQIDTSDFDADWSQAQAAHDSHSDEGHSGGPKGKGKRGSHHSDGHDEGGDDHGGGHSGKKGHKSKRSPSDAVQSDVLRGKGRSKRPVWAGGGIPHVELGRLNASRAPAFVLDRALAEAQTELANDPNADVHSPLANLAMYRELVKINNLTPEQITKAAQMLGKAADMRIPISNDTVEAVNIILGTGLNLSNDQVTALSQQADVIRAERLASHGGDDTSHDH